MYAKLLMTIIFINLHQKPIISCEYITYDNTQFIHSFAGLTFLKHIFKNACIIVQLNNTYQIIKSLFYI